MRVQAISIEPFRRPFLKGVRQGLYLHITTICGKKVMSESAPLPGFSVETLAQIFSEAATLDRHFKGFDLTLFSPKQLLCFLPANAWALYSGFTELLEPQPTAFSIPLCGYIDPLLIQSEKDLKPLEPFSSVKVKLKNLNYQQAFSFFKHFAPFFSGKSIRIDGNLTFCVNDVQNLMNALPFLKGVEYVEEPLGWEKETFSFPLALDESLRASIATYANKNATWVIKPMLDFSLVLPLLEKKKGANGQKTVLSSSYETEVGIYHIARLSKQVNSTSIAMGLDTLKLFASHKAPGGYHVLVKDGQLACAKKLEKSYA